MYAKDVIEFRILMEECTHPSLHGWALSAITCILKEKQPESLREKRRKQHVHRIRTRVKWPQARES